MDFMHSTNTSELMEKRLATCNTGPRSVTLRRQIPYTHMGEVHWGQKTHEHMPCWMPAVLQTLKVAKISLCTHIWSLQAML